MKLMKFVVLALLVLGAVSGNLYAEYRIWTSTADDVVEAEFIRVAGNDVILQLRGDKELTLPIDKLIAEDQEYILIHTPPALDLKVTADIDRSNDGKTTQKQQVVCSATIRKTSKAPYPLPLTATLFVFCKDVASGNVRVDEKIPATFSFKEDAEPIHQFSSEPIALAVNLRRKSGKEYNGYLLVVVDSMDKVIATKASRASYEEDIDALLGTSPDDSKKKRNK